MLEEFERVIVVDWSCPQNSGEWAKKEGAEVVQVKGQQYFSASKARNLGARKCSSRSIVFIDADTMVMTGLRAEVEELLDLRHMVVASRTSQNLEVHDLGGFLAVDIGQFWGVGGYNEELEGYALEDCYLRAQLLLERGLQVKRVSPGSLGAMRHTNSMRGAFHKEPIEVGARKNFLKLTDYLGSHGVSDWINDPRTAEIAYRVSP